VRHHYSVTSTGLDPDEAGRFHTFEEANSRFEEVFGRAKESGAELTEQSYWRRFLSSSGRSAKVALDDVGLLACGSECEGG
jgi:hypothetical protein